MKKVKPKSQIQKEIDSLQTRGNLNAYPGLRYSSVNNQIGLIYATPNEIGGVRYSWSEEQDSGLTSPDGMRLQTATSYRLGGIRLGDGLAPGMNYGTDGNYYPTKYVGIRLYANGNGLQFVDNNELTEDPLERAQNRDSGRALSLKLGWGLAINDKGAVYVTDAASGKGSILAGNGIIVETSDDGNTISINLGDGLEFDESGAIKTKAGGGSGGSYAAGGGITIEEGEENSAIAVNVGEGLEIGADGALNALINADNSIVIQEEAAKLLLHSYELVEYVAGNKIVCINVPQYLIVCNNCVCGRAFADEYTTGMGTYANPVFALMRYGSVIYSGGGFKTAYARDYNNNNLLAVCYTPDGLEAGRYATAGTEKVGFKLYWLSVNPPTADYPYGYIVCHVNFAIENADGTQSNVKSWEYIEIGFASEAEYNASIGLTYASETMTAVEETVTEVTE